LSNTGKITPVSFTPVVNYDNVDLCLS